LSIITTPGDPGGALNAAALAGRLAPYRRPSTLRAAVEIAITIGPLAAIFVLAWTALAHHIWWGLALAPLAAAFLMRLFMIQHDCGHGAFLPGRRLNDWLGRALGVLTLTPYDYWRRAHAIHHATSGALDRRTIGGIDTLTVSEYRALPALRRMGYRLYRHPLVMFGLGPAFVFLVQHRLPVGMMGGGWRPWVSTMVTNLCALALVTTLALAFGAWPFLLIYLPVVTLAASMGVWLFFVQHQFEDTYWARDGAWEFHDAAFHGSSHYDLPAPLRWLTANIGVHHVHHLSSRIPFYRLGQVMRDEPSLRAAGRLTLWRSLGCVGLALWDDTSRRLISFRQMRRLAGVSAGDSRGCGGPAAGRTSDEGS
jgi:omega-6 fatty acid desaturase (delta-12 desaturase)